MSECGCHEDKGIPGVTASTSNPQFPSYHYNYQCQCGCLELRERVAILEQNLYQVTLILQNKDKAQGETQPKRRFIGDTTGA